MSYMQIHNINDVLPHIKDKPEIKLSKVGKFTVINYMMVDSHTFDNKMAIECRGIAFHEDGTIAHRPLHKFFNLGEIYYPELKFDFKKKFKVYDKLDGSMIGISLVGKNELLIKTRATNLSDQALAVEKYLRDTGLYGKLVEFMKSDTTYIFEYTSPDNMIVIQYPDVSLTLLAVRNNHTGNYDDLSAYTSTTSSWNRLIKLPIVQHKMMTMSEVVKTIDEEQDCEGYVIHVAGLWIKVKNSWYINLHKAITMLRYRDVAKLVVDGQIDDLKANLIINNVDITNIVEIEDRILSEVKAIQKETTNSLYGFMKLNPEATSKDVALNFKDHKYFTTIMATFNGKEVSYMDYWAKVNLKSLPLDNVGVTYNRKEMQNDK